jgi:hypothetical protein
LLAENKVYSPAPQTQAAGIECPGDIAIGREFATSEKHEEAA